MNRTNANRQLNRRRLAVRLAMFAIPWIAALQNGAWRPGAVSAAEPADDLARQATWTAPDAAALRETLHAWFTRAERTAEELDAFAKIWSAPGSDTLDRVALSLALGDAEAKAVVDMCAKPGAGGQAPAFAILDDPAQPDFVRNNLRLIVGRWLVHEQMHDEAHEHLSALSPAGVADPAALLFYQAIANQRLLNKEPALESIARLLERERQLPKRYSSVARLMQADLAKLEEDSLDHIARRMDDVRRRLDLGRAGARTRDVQDGVIESLDKLIEEMERQQQQQEQQNQPGDPGSQDQPRANQPAPDSMPLSGKGPGEVAPKKIGNQSGWGKLPPKQREEVMQQIGRDFPAHYRDVIEQYFRQLAQGDEAEEGP